jgi:putative membrane protein
MRFVIRLLINAVALYVATRIVPGVVYDGQGFTGILLVALVFGVLNAFLRPILTLLTCPLQMLTLGLFTIVINAIMLLLTSAASDFLGLGFHVDGLWPAVVGALVVSLVSILLSLFVREDHDRR